MASVPHNLSSAPSTVDTGLFTKESTHAVYKPVRVSFIEKTIRATVLSLLGAVAGYAVYDRIANRDYYALQSEMNTNMRENGRPTWEFVRKITPELHAIERELSEANGDPKILQSILGRLEKIWADLPDKQSSFGTSAQIRTMLGQAQESLGNTEAAYGHFSYAAQYAELAEMPESASLKEKVAELQTKLPSPEERLRQWRETHGSLNTDTGVDMAEQFKQQSQKQNPAETVAAGGEG